jgi:hypothetical protein
MGQMGQMGQRWGASQTEIPTRDLPMWAGESISKDIYIYMYIYMKITSQKLQVLSIIRFLDQYLASE